MSNTNANNTLDARTETLNLIGFTLVYNVKGRKLPITVMARDKAHAAKLGLPAMRQRLRQPTFSGIPTITAKSHIR